MPPKRIRIPGRLHRRKKNIFTSRFEEKKALEYLRNLISSRFLTHETEGLFIFSWTVLDKKTISGLIIKRYSEILNLRQFKKDLEMGRPDTEMLSASQMEGLLQDDIASLVSNILASVSECNDTDIETRLSTIKKTFDLTDEEIEVVSLFYLREVSSELCIALEGVMPDLTNISVFRSYGNILLGFDMIRMRF